MPDLRDDPAAMTPSQRRREIAAILARGVLRVRECASASDDSGETRTVEKAPDSGQTCLELDATSSPHVPAG